MHAQILPDRRRITIAILALGGQGGGVLADWILDVARQHGYVAQGTSVPGVAQRTGSTIYYIEMVPLPSGDNRVPPVLALNPVPGDVDIVIASELMEAGRAILRGFVSKERTTLIGSTHRIYAISEKSALGDGTGSSARILAAAQRRAARFVGFDMDEAAHKAGSLISSVMLGALAGSDALPFTPAVFEAAIRADGRAVEANLKGFAAGIDGTRIDATAAVVDLDPPVAHPTTSSGHALAKRVEAALPASAHCFAIEGARRLMDYQDVAYARLYLDRLDSVCSLDSGADDWALTRETARSLALWMAYEDVIRVADLKIRASRSARIADEMRIRTDQLIRVTEYMHPRLREMCDILPTGIGRGVLSSPMLCRWLAPVFASGRHVETTGIRWFLALRITASLRRFRRTSMRFGEEQSLIEAWLHAIRTSAAHDTRLAAELARNQRLLKGYGETFDRGRARFDSVMTAAAAHGIRDDAAQRVSALRSAALADETGCALDQAIAAHGVLST